MWGLEVGQPFCKGRVQWAPATVEYRYDTGVEAHHLLQINQRGVTTGDLDAFHAGEVHMGLFVDCLVPFVLVRIEGFYDWSDQPSSINLLPPAQWQLHQWYTGMQLSLALVLVDADTGIVLGKRMVMYSSHVSRVFYDALKMQLETPYGKEVIEAVRSRVYQRYGSSKDMVRAATVVHRTTPLL
jgi:hypothetical protein